MNVCLTLCVYACVCVCVHASLYASGYLFSAIFYVTIRLYVSFSLWCPLMSSDVIASNRRASTVTDLHRNVVIMYTPVRRTPPPLPRHIMRGFGHSTAAAAVVRILAL